MGPCFGELLLDELARARLKHPTPIRSRHEGHSILLEEFREVEEAVFKDLSDQHLLTEIVQVAAMAMRMAEDLHLLVLERRAV